MQVAQMQAYSFERTPCSNAISGPMNRVFDIKSGHDFCRCRNSIQVIDFQVNDYNPFVNVPPHFIPIFNIFCPL